VDIPKRSLAAGLCLLLFFLASHVHSLNWVEPADWSVIAVLAIFLVGTQGLQSSGYLERGVQFVADRDLTAAALSAWLVGVSALLGAFVTNDVSLFVIVPLTLAACSRRSIPSARLIVLETMAANVGSMAMPWGNPQNIYLFHRYQLGSIPFYRLTAPPSIVMACLLCLAAYFLAPRSASTAAHEPAPPLNHTAGVMSLLIAGAGVLHLLHALPGRAGALAIGSVLMALVIRPSIVLAADWGLLALFGLIFAVTHGIEVSPVAHRIPELFGGWERTFLASVGLSQCISNVPTALIAARSIVHATADGWQAAPIGAPVAAVLMGVEVGGLGTPIASLANLIGLRLYLRNGGDGRAFWSSYWLLNGAGLLIFLIIGQAVLSVYLR
jgi:Na+/H+ antiporter NhaD/arsenite permease-like protein